MINIMIFDMQALTFHCILIFILCAMYVAPLSITVFGCNNQYRIKELEKMRQIINLNI